MFSAPVTGNPVLLVLASLTAGLFIALLLYLGYGLLKTGQRSVAGIITEAERRTRRERGVAQSPAFAKLVAVLSLMTPHTSKLPLGSLSKSLLERYARAGWPGGLTDDELVAGMVLLSAVLTVVIVPVVLIINPVFLPFAIIGPLLGPGLLSSQLGALATKRDGQIARTMPFVLDLLVLVMRAGASLPMGLERVAQDYAKHPIGAEFRSVIGDIEMGVSARQAFKNMAERVPTHSIRSFTDELIQAEELGRPLADTLESMAGRVRVRRIQEANEIAGKAKVMVLVPGMLVFISALILLFAPFGVKYYYGGFESELQEEPAK